MAVTAQPKLDAQKIRADFAYLEELRDGKPVAFLDSAASTQKPRQVLDALREFYEYSYANVHRGVYQLAERATAGYEGAREKVRAFINAPSTGEVVFTRSATESINVVAYAWEVFTGTRFDDNYSLVAHGALYGPLVVQQGQWWRIVTGGFLHGGLAHIALNMFALYQLGTFVESALGPWRMLAVYVISLFGGGLAVVYFSPNDVTVGASGAIFGLFGALIGIGLRLGQRGRALIAQTAPVLVINLVFTFAVPFISKSAHIGGLVSGLFAGLALFAMQRRPPTPVVVDAATGEEANAEYLPPPEPRRVE